VFETLHDLVHAASAASVFKAPFNQKWLYFIPIFAEKVVVVGCCILDSDFNGFLTIDEFGKVQREKLFKPNVIVICKVQASPLLDMLREKLNVR